MWECGVNGWLHKNWRGLTCRGSEVGVSLACAGNRGSQDGWIVGSKKESGGRVGHRAGRLRSHSLEGPAKDFEAHPKKQKAVERFLTEEYHDLISVECNLAFLKLSGCDMEKCPNFLPPLCMVSVCSLSHVVWLKFI